jgi:signal transduction histidine kinase
VLKRINTQIKITVLLIVVLIVTTIANSLWSTDRQVKQAEAEMLEKVQILNQEMQAVWDFIDINQMKIDTDADGNYNFKNIYCAIAGKVVAKLFSRDNDYEIRYISLMPRQKSSTPDAFEMEAFDPFVSENSNSEYYGITTYNGKDVFRYVSPIYAKESCLTCHGDPKGEIDITGNPKEGYKVGDLAGAVSIIMPIDIYMQGIQNNIVQQSIFFFAVVAIMIAIIYFAVTVLIMHPLRKMREAVEQIEGGNLDIEFMPSGTAGDLGELESKFASMSSQLKGLYESLEQQVSERTSQLANANQILEQSRIELENINEKLITESRYKSDFFAIMSHELKTPLTSIIAFIEIWEHNDTIGKTHDPKVLREIKDNSQILLQMVSNILETARIEAGKVELNYEIINMIDLLSTIESTIKPIAEKRSVAFSTSVQLDTPFIFADWEKLRRIIENLASNAVKFTQRGGEVSIDVAVVPTDENREPDEICIAVSDTGSGIKEEELQIIFDAFTQKDKSAYRRYKGSGLGLSVVKQLVDAHDGSIEVKSEVKKGSTFTVHMPISKSKEERSDEDHAC